MATTYPFTLYFPAGTTLKQIMSTTPAAFIQALPASMKPGKILTSYIAEYVNFVVNKVGDLSQFANQPVPTTITGNGVVVYGLNDATTTTTTAAPATIPQPGDPGYQAYINSLSSGGSVGGSDPLSILNSLLNAILQPIRDIGSALQGFAGGVNAIVAYVGEIVQKIKNAATNTGDLIKWIDQPATLERFAAIIIGGFMFFIGLNAIVLSFVDVKQVAETVKIAASI